MGPFRFCFLTIFFWLSSTVALLAQVINTGVADTIVSMNRHNEATVNLAMLDLRYNSSRLRARVAPGFGSYMNANYTAEQGGMKFLVEANAGVKLFSNKDIWLDFGILGSPYTNESCVSRDHLMYTRSLAPEYVPYYLAGAKFSIPVHKKWSVYLYLVNGWQQIADQNKGKSIGTQVEYRPDDRNLINWDTYIGDERSEANPYNRMRYFTDVYWIHNPNGVFSVTSCLYAGIQQRQTAQGLRNDGWWQANVIGRYKLSQKTSISGRIEYFHDRNSVQIVNLINQGAGFRTAGAGICLNQSLFDNALFRLEGRQLFSLDNPFTSANGKETGSSLWLLGNLTVWF
ncbi:MAG: porin [Saprospiraceae bacterium]|nr:porin [Saprospiraceae bacterium]